ncbi:glycosyltransferase family 4 protein [Oryzomonas japonica]|uniref:Glycosyltransferase family 4 protein n=1 Tax=Oryzomonas japonica TaxID=2603858 RepID=A0A7J4ZRL0_9BACT|nr:glycosyltransferase family 4 protein [Oryzomonas japonica]KAB0665279.1 glycosyltransferase family 4 protein [Oryzomonas japonica]
MSGDNAIITIPGCALFLGLLGAWLMSRYAYRFGLLDIPNNRSSHELPTPRGGGIGILAALIVSALYLRVPTFFWLPATLLSLASFFDDRQGLSPRTRLILQFAASLAVLFPQLPAFSSSPATPYLLLPIACLFMAGTANFYNFMDGINGIAGITGFVGFALLGIFAGLTTQAEPYRMMAFSLSAACLGFLPMNMPRARVFMGDVGSVLLGFMFAAFCILLSASFGDFIVLAGCLFPFYADALTTLAVRWRDGDRLSLAHRRHLYQLFANQMNIPHWQVAAGYGILQLLVGSSMLALRKTGSIATIPLGLVLFGCWWLVMSRVRTRVEVK